MTENHAAIPVKYWYAGHQIGNLDYNTDNHVTSDVLSGDAQNNLSSQTINGALQFGYTVDPNQTTGINGYVVEPNQPSDGHAKQTIQLNVTPNTEEIPVIFYHGSTQLGQISSKQFSASATGISGKMNTNYDLSNFVQSHLNGYTLDSGEQAALQNYVIGSTVNNNHGLSANGLDHQTNHQGTTQPVYVEVTANQEAIPVE